MLRTSRKLKSCTLGARDGEIGAVRDLYFDEIGWAVRYFVVETGAWLRSRKVLISPEAVRAGAWSGDRLPVELTTDQVRNSPDVDADQPVSRQYEAQMREHYRWPPYWGGGAVSRAPRLRWPARSRSGWRLTSPWQGATRTFSA